MRNLIIHRKVIVLTILLVFLVGGIPNICYSQTVSGTSDEVMSATEMRENVLPTVVYIKSKRGFGSGVVIKTSEDNTFVLTNEHVTRGSDEIEVFFLAYDAKQNEIRDREFYFGSQHATTLLRRLGYAIDGRVVAEDKEADVAVINLYRFPKTIESILLKDVDVYDHLKAGDMVHFFGHPQDQELLWQWNLGQFKGYEDRGLFLEARSWKGNSGGPLLNKKGELIGLIKASDDVTKAWAVPLEPIIDLVKDLKGWDIISIVNETESDVVYEVNWSEGETWERNTLESGQWKIHRHPTDADGSFQTKIRYVSTGQQTPQGPVDTDTKKPEKQNDKKPEEQNDKNDENIVNNEHELRYIKRRFFSSDDTDRIKPKLDGYNYRFVSPDSKNIEFQEKRQTVWIANNSTKTQKYSIRWSADRFDEDTYSLEPGKAKPHWSTRTILGFASNYPKIQIRYSIFNSAEHTKHTGILERSITTTEEMQFFPIDAKPDEHIKDIEDVRKTIKDNVKGYYNLHVFQENEIPHIHVGLPTPEKKQEETPDTPENEQTETSKKWEKLIMPICLGIIAICHFVVVVVVIQYYFPKIHTVSIGNSTDSTVNYHIKWTKKANWKPSSLEPGKSRIHFCPGFLKKKPELHYAQIVNYQKRTGRIKLETRSRRYRRNADPQNYQEYARKYDFDHTETNEIQIFDSETE